MLPAFPVIHPGAAHPALGWPLNMASLIPRGFKPFALNGIQRPVEPPLGAAPDDGGVYELAGDHQSRRTGRGFVVPTG